MGKAKLAVGRIQVTSDITWNAAPISFAVLHFGDHNLCSGVREFHGEEAYGIMAWEVAEGFSWVDFPETIRYPTVKGWPLDLPLRQGSKQI